MDDAEDCDDFWAEAVAIALAAEENALRGLPAAGNGAIASTAAPAAALQPAPAVQQPSAPVLRAPQPAAKPPLAPRRAPAPFRAMPQPDSAAFTTPPAVVEDSYSRRLREKDEELNRVVQSKDGEIANLRHKMRALSSQIEARASPAPVTPKRPAPGAAAYAVEDRNRLQKEVTVAQADLSRMSEKLLYAQQEISAMQEREQRREVEVLVAAAAAPSQSQSQSQRERAKAADASAAAPSQSQSQRAPRRAMLVPSAVDFPDPGTLGGTQLPSSPGGEVVEPTQAAYEMSRRDPQRPRRRGRRGNSLSAGDPASSSLANSQAMSPTQVLSRAILSAEEMPPPSFMPANAAGSLGGSGGKRYRTPEKDGDADVEPLKPEVQLVCIDKSADIVAESEQRDLRHALFGEGRAERLLQLCTSLGNRELRAAIAGAMASDRHWLALLRPLSSLGNDGATSVALTAICALTEHSRACRGVLAYSRADDPVISFVLRTLEQASGSRDASLASLALRIISCVVSEICAMEDNGVEAGADKPEAPVATRRRLEHDAVLLWLQQREAQSAPACAAAAEIASELILNIVGTPVAHHDQREGDFLEQAVLCFAVTLPILTVNPDVKARALCSLDWTSQVAPYLLDERDARVMESLCTFVVDLVHRMRLRVMLLEEAQTSFCELLEDDAAGAAPQCWDIVRGDIRQASTFDCVGSEEAQVASVQRAVRIAQRLVRRGTAGMALAAEVSPSTRNVALGTLAFLGWPDEDPKTQRYPAVKSLHADPSLAGDARIVYDALIRSEPN